MIQMQKTHKKLAELTETMNKEINEACALFAAEERLSTIRQQEEALEARIGIFEKHKIWTTPDECLGGDNKHATLERNNKIVASVITAMEYVKTHPTATGDDVRRLGLPLPDVMDPATIVMIVRCSKIVERYEAHKTRLMSNVFELVRGVPAEG